MHKTQNKFGMDWCFNADLSVQEFSRKIWNNHYCIECSLCINLTHLTLTHLQFSQMAADCALLTSFDCKCDYYRESSQYTVVWMTVPPSSTPHYQWSFISLVNRRAVIHSDKFKYVNCIAALCCLIMYCAMFDILCVRMPINFNIRSKEQENDWVWCRNWGLLAHLCNWHI